MTEEKSENSGLVPYVRAQVDYIIEAFDRKFDGQGPAIKVVPEDGGVGFMYAEGQILVRDDYLDRVQALLGDHVTPTRNGRVMPDRMIPGPTIPDPMIAAQGRRLIAARSSA